MSVTCDNVTANTSMIDELEFLLPNFPGQKAHVRCFAHTVNLTAKGVLRPFEPVKALFCKNSTASKENTDPKTPAPKSRVSSEKPQSKNPSKSANNSSAPEKLPRRRAIFSEDDDRVMITVLLEQKLEGMASDNGGWKKPAINAVVVALEGSELTSGGSPKTFRSVQDHYSKLKNDYRVFKELASISGWGWDPENHRVQASEEQWNTYLA
ncbi:hypothetical protein F5878DRAFT_646736, partial [Lentinula raphanica]